MGPRSRRLNPLDLKQPDVRVVPDRRIHVSATRGTNFTILNSERSAQTGRPGQLPKVDDAPHVGAEPHGGAGVGLVLPDEDGVRHRKQAHQSTVLQELQDLRLVCQTPESNKSTRQIRVLTFICSTV